MSIGRLLLLCAKHLLKSAKGVRRAFLRLDTAAASCIDSANWREGGTMRGLWWCGLFFLLLGCAEYEAKLAAQHAAEDDAKCQSYGGKRGEQAYVQCRAQLDAARTQARATAAAAVIQVPPPQPPPPLMPLPVVPPIPPAPRW
jgi:hypothetical protein